MSTEGTGMTAGDEDKAVKVSLRAGMVVNARPPRAGYIFPGASQGRYAPVRLRGGCRMIQCLAGVVRGTAEPELRMEKTA